MLVCELLLVLGRFIGWIEHGVVDELLQCLIAIICGVKSNCWHIFGL